MNLKELNQIGKLETLVLTAIILAIVLCNFLPKELFVSPTGKFEIFGNSFGILLVIGLYLKWKYIRTIVSISTFLAIVGILMTFSLSHSINLAFIILLFALSISFYLSTFSKGVKSYLN